MKIYLRGILTNKSNSIYNSIYVMIKEKLW